MSLIPRPERRQRRPLGLWMCTAFVVGILIGSGIFGYEGDVAVRIARLTDRFLETGACRVDLLLNSVHTDARADSN